MSDIRLIGGINLLSVLLIVSSTHHLAEATEPRLIETAPGQRQWLNEIEINQLSVKKHIEENKCPGFMDITDYPDVDSSKLSAWIDWDTRVPSHADEVDPLIAQISAEEMRATVEKLSSYPTRHCKSASGAESAQWIADRFKSLSIDRSDVSVSLFAHKRFNQPSVIARLEGRGPYAHETVVIGAHQDSINMFGGNAPGADDDASGVATLIEAFRVLTASGFVPDRSIEFIAYAGEEIGLIGSQDISQKYKADQRLVAGALQFDMTMFPGKEKPMVFIVDNVDLGMTTFIKMLVDSYVHLAWKDARCGYACSDHASWTRAGYPSAFPFEAPTAEDNKKIHTTEDVLSRLDVDHGAHYARLAIAFAVEMAREVASTE